MNVSKFAGLNLCFWCIMTCISANYSAQNMTYRTSLTYSFGLQKMDFFHQFGVGLHGKHFGLELQQGLGQRSLSSGMYFGQTNIQTKVLLGGRLFEISPFLRYGLGYLGKPFGFRYHRVDGGFIICYKLSQFTKFPLDVFLSGGIGKGEEVQSPQLRFAYLEYSVYLGLRYAFR